MKKIILFLLGLIYFFGCSENKPPKQEVSKTTTVPSKPKAVLVKETQQKETEKPTIKIPTFEDSSKVLFDTIKNFYNQNAVMDTITNIAWAEKFFVIKETFDTTITEKVLIRMEDSASQKFFIRYEYIETNGDSLSYLYITAYPYKKGNKVKYDIEETVTKSFSSYEYPVFIEKKESLRKFFLLLKK